MNIAIIESKLDGKGGNQRQALSFALAFQKLGHKVTMYTIRYNKEKCFSDILDQLRVVSLPRVYAPPVPIKIPGLGFLNYLRYARTENRAAYDLALLIDPDTDILNPHDRLGFHVASYYKKYVRDISSVLMMSDILTKSWIAWRKSQFDSSLKPTLKSRLFNWICDAYEVRKYIRPHEGMTTLDIRTKDWARDYFGKEAVVVRSGLDIDQFPFIAHKGCNNKRVRILAAGIFFLHRRYEDVIHAVRLLRERGYDATLSVIGNYTANNEYRGYHKRLASLAKTLGVEDKVVFTGEVTEDELRRCYQTHDVYVSPNHLQSWGLSVFEAMASGLPVIVSKTAGAAEILNDNEQALLIDAKSPDQIADAIKRLADDSKLYMKMSNNGRTFVENRISWERSAKATLSVFEDVMAVRTN